MIVALLLAYLGRAALAAVAVRRVPTLRPVALACATMAALDALDAVGAPWLRAGVAVAWPGAAVGLAAWGLRAGGGGAQVHGPGARERARFTAKDGARVLVVAILLGYLLAGLVAAACYGPAHAVYPPLLLGSRLVAVAVVVALLLRRRPSTWAELAAVVPALALALGVVAGAWPLAQGGLLELARGWWLAHLETWIALGAESAAIGLAWRYHRPCPATSSAVP